MEKIKSVEITECDESFYIKPARMSYEQNGKKKTWDLMRIHDSFRPAVYLAGVEFEDCEGCIDIEKYPPSLGITVELCAGIVDKDESLAEIARDEILEECGYSVPLSAMQKVTSYRSGVGVAGSLQTLYYVEITDSMKVSEGGGNAEEGEYIEVIEMDLPQAHSLIFDEKVARPTSLLLALMWFFQNKASNFSPKL